MDAVKKGDMGLSVHVDDCTHSRLASVLRAPWRVCVSQPKQTMQCWSGARFIRCIVHIDSLLSVG